MASLLNGTSPADDPPPVTATDVPPGPIGGVMDWLHGMFGATPPETRPIWDTTNPIGTETLQMMRSATPSAPAEGGFASNILPNIRRGAQAVGDFLTTDVMTPMADALSHPGVSLPEGGKWINTDSGMAVQLPDGKVIYPEQLNRRAAFVPVETEQQWPYRTSLAMPGAVDVLPAAGTGGVVPEGALAANAIRRSGPGVVGRLAPEVPEFVPPAVFEAHVDIPPRALPTWMEPGANDVPRLSRLEPGQLFDPARGVEAARGATQGLSQEAYDELMASRERLLDPGIAALNKIGKGERGNASLPNLRELPPDEAAAIAATDPHLAFKRPDGNYVGAPPGVKTMEDVQRLRDAFDAQVARGVSGSDWYDRVQAYIAEISGGDPILARQIAEEWAITSAQADPFTNTGFSAQGRNARAVGVPRDIVRTGQVARTFNEARDAQEAFLADQTPGRNSIPNDPEQTLAPEFLPRMPLGKKTDIYRQHMDPTAPEGATGTNDIWHGRGFGFFDPLTGQEWSKAFGPAQHNWLDYETLQAVNRANAAGLGGRDNWTAAEIQAAPWVAGKMESLQRRFKLPPDEAAARANATYPDFTRFFEVSMPGEAVPGQATGLTTGSMSPEDWTAAMARVSPGGVDPQLTRMGIINRATQTGGYGGWYEDGMPAPQTNPVNVARPQIAMRTVPKTDTTPARRIADPATMTALDMAAHVRGLNDFQIGSPATFWDRRAPSGKATSITIDLGRATTEPEAAALVALANKHKLTFANTGEGAGFLNFDQAAKGGDVQKMLNSSLADAIKKIVPDATIGRADTNSANKYAFYGDRLNVENQGQGLGTRYLDEQLQAGRGSAPGAYRTLMDDPNEAAHSQEILRLLRDSGQLGKRPDYELWHRLVAEGRLRDAIAWARANGYKGLPVVAGGVVPAAGLQGGGDSTDTGP